MKLHNVLDVLLRAAVVLVATEAVTWLYDEGQSQPDALASGLTALMVMASVSALWGMLDGFRWRPLRLCLTWIATGVLVAAGTWAWDALRYGSIDWSGFAGDLSFFALLVSIAAIACGVIQSSFNKPVGQPR
ncbi:MAG: hypothetical protein QM655_01890 [Nocardioidaceae bacterium]